MIKYLLISAHHDYRTPRRASIHFVADELSKRGKVGFFSFRFSRLSKSKGDYRWFLSNRANSVEEIDGVQSYLWKTPIHPFGIGSRFLQPLERLLYWFYVAFCSRTLLRWAKEAEYIIYESGVSAIFFEKLKKLNPSAKHIYKANDDLATINTSQTGRSAFNKVCGLFDSIGLVSKSMAASIPSTGNVFLVPHGLNPDFGAEDEPSPYTGGLHAVSLGSMLFDPSFFEIAGEAFPEVTFHVIGSGSPRSDKYAENVKTYGEIKFSETTKFIKHASFGIAPYRAATVPYYLADSSLKMMQYDYFALPTVCPQNVCGEYSHRFGYTPGDTESIKAAITGALKGSRIRSRQILTWSAVTDRLLSPTKFPDTHIAQSN